jgi:hypothetical protein
MALFDFGAADAREERDYWLDRADFHLDLGEKTADTRASWAHYQLAGRYLDKAYGDASPRLADRQMTPELAG